MRRNNRRGEYQTPPKLIENRDDWERIAKEEISKDNIKSSVYKGERTVRGEKKYEVRDSLKSIFHSKCAYCENIEKKPEVEHFRPKLKVDEDLLHPGYFWLCYEWTNLLPSCRYCNTEGGKGNQFPVLGNRVNEAPVTDNNFITDRCKINAVELLEERPLLLNPETDNVEDYFRFDKTGKIIGTDEEGRGEMTRKICNLNRDNLLALRQEIIDEHVADIEDIVKENTSEEKSQYSFNQIKRKLDRIRQKCSSEHKFSLVYINILALYEELIVSQIQTPNQKEFVKLAHKEYIDENFK